ncbi:MAG: DUF58 domain-containing protein [Deltaproteobacteria bacterium]|nr:DUF58 domain-containing protein [Deltaproteobacteria bacterium]
MRRRWHFMMTPMEHTSIRWMDDVYRAWLTPAGRAWLWAVTGCGVMLLGGLVPLLLGAFGFMLAVLVASVLVGAAFRPTVRLERHVPAFPSAGEVLSYRVRVTNTGRRPARLLAIEERGLPFEVRPAGEPAVVERLDPGESTEVTLRAACNLRGAYALRRLQASSSFPSGIVKWPRVQRHAERLLVYPAFQKLAHLEVPHGRNYQPGGIAVASHVGDSVEFVGLRPYREGDRLRDVHWPTVARTGNLVVKEYQEEYFVRLALVLDVEVRNARDERLLDRALSSAAALADALARQDYIIDIFCAGTEIHHFRAGRALAHFDNILELLAAIEGGDRLDVAGLEAVLVPEAEKLSAVIMVVMDWDDARAALAARLRAHGVALRVLCVRPGRALAGLPPDEQVVLP